MTTGMTDRTLGLLTDVAIKAPCLVASTANLTLSGLQTVDGVALASNDRVLVKDQTTASENGIYLASTASWTRSTDFDGSNDVVTGTIVKVTSGTVNAGFYGEVTTTGTISPGTTSLTIAMRFGTLSTIGALASKDTAANSDLAQMPANTLSGNNTNATANRTNLTIAQLVTMLTPRSYLAGLTLSNDGTTPNTVLDIASGVAMSDDNTAVMSLAAFTKMTGAWTAGTGNGGLDTGTVANGTWYHVYVIKRVDTGVVDVLFSTSVSAPTMPTNYTVKRRIGSFKTDGSAHILAFTQDGDYFVWSASSVDVNAAANPGTSAVTRTLTVPTGVNVLAFGSVNVNTDGTVSSVLLSDLAVTDVGATATNSQLAAQPTTGQNTASFSVRTNTSAQIRSRLSASVAATQLTITTKGWFDSRGRLA